MLTLFEIRQRSHAMAAHVVELGADAALSYLETCWAARATRHLGASDERIRVGYDEARRALDRLETDADRFWARHYLTIYAKVTALPVETGGFGVEAVLDGAGPSGGRVTGGA